MNRREFTKPVAVEIVKRAIMPGSAWPNCEECHASCKRFEIHHIRADGLEVDKSAKLAAAEGQLLCIPCHAEKTKADVAAIAKAKRREALHVGAKPTPRRPIQFPGFPAKPAREPKQLPPRRGGIRYIDTS
jgi:hypothetical protein